MRAIGAQSVAVRGDLNLNPVQGGGVELIHLPFDPIQHFEKGQQRVPSLSYSWLNFLVRQRDDEENMVPGSAIRLYDA
jgi:hypothetical protein